MTDQQIADELGCSVWTVRRHLTNLRNKFTVDNRVELLMAVLTAGALDGWPKMANNSEDRAGPLR